MNLSECLSYARPGARWSLTGNDLASLIWIGPGDPPTLAELENAVLPPPPPVTRRQLKRWLLAQGLLAQVPALIAAITDDNARAEAQIDWEDASVFEVTNPLVVNFATALGLDNEQLHAAWREAALIE